MKFLLVLSIFIANASASSTFWDSDFPDHVDQYIYKQTHATCMFSDYIDSIIASETFQSSNGRTYIADFSAYDDINGYISVVETLDGKLYLEDIECPSL